MDVLDARLCLELHGLAGLGDVALARLFFHYGSTAKIWDSNPSHWTLLGVSRAVARDACARRESVLNGGCCPEVVAQLEALERQGAEVIPLPDDRYPVLLRTLPDPPPILYCRGDHQVLQQAQLGVVGARRASPPGSRAARALSARLVDHGLAVCSGLAVGIDQAAHRGALEAGGQTVAVMATGLDVIYPRVHRELADRIADSGCLLTENPPGCQPLPGRFPKRNRIISGLSLGVLVIEGALRSGSLITARMALEQGREVFALPWSMFHPLGKGCLSLIRDGAKMVVGIEDILEELGPLYQFQAESRPPPEAASREATAVSADEQAVLALIGEEATSLDEVTSHCTLNISQVMAALSNLELAKCITRCEGGYVRN